MSRTAVSFALLAFSLTAWAVRPDLKKLPIGFAPGESPVQSRGVSETAAPVGPIHALGEWEEPDTIMTLWSNASMVSAFVKRSKVMLIADTRSDQDWWKSWLQENGINESGVSYFQVATDSMWIRDYGPWFLVDGKGQFGLVHNTYNRPRPLDNQVAFALAKDWNVPIYDTGLVHTGGNYYEDGVGNAFSSTLVYEENSSLSVADVNQRMLDFLGIQHYITQRLNPGISIEHMDTYGKLVAPDTFVFGEFPDGSEYKADSDAYAAMLATLKSPYGTPYKISRLKMADLGGRFAATRSGGREAYRAYINSFISGHALYYATYGNDSTDQYAKQVYQAAMPGYEIVGVEAPDTEWGDSVHCRNRSRLKQNTIFIFPTIPQLPSDARAETAVVADVIPSPGASLNGTPQVTWMNNGVRQGTLAMAKTGTWQYKVTLPAQPSGTKVSIFVTASDSAGITKTAPLWAPQQTIDFQVP